MDRALFGTAWIGIPRTLLARGDDATSTSEASSSGSGGAGQSSSSGPGSSSSGAGGQGTGGATSGSGIASSYPGDEGIEADPAVSFAHGFETYTQPSELESRWDAVYQLNRIRFATEQGRVRFGAKSLEFEVPQQEAELSDVVDWHDDVVAATAYIGPVKQP